VKSDGLAFHAFRRFRKMHLGKIRARRDPENYWIGDANKGVTGK
jgi:hypothetical protein